MSFYSDASLVLIPSGYKDQKVYSAVPTDGSGDLVFSRASSATRVASNGLIEKVRTNLILQSNTFSTTWASAGSGGATVTSGQADPNSGTSAWLLAKGGVSGRIEQNITMSANEQTFSIVAKKGTSNFLLALVYDGTTSHSSYFNLDSGAVGTQSNAVGSIVSLGGGWYRCSVTSTNLSASGIIQLYISDTDGGVSGTTGNIYIYQSQFENGVATDYIATTSAAVSVGPVSGLPRLDYLGSTCGKLTLEPQRSNAALYSEQFNNAFWGKNESTILANTTATLDPTGYYGADKLQENTVNSSHNFGDGTISATSGQAVTFSIFFKAAERTWGALRLYTGASSVFGWYNLANGTLGTIGAGGTGSIVSYGNGWYRCSLTITMVGNSVTLPFVFTSTGNGVIDYAGTTGSGIYCFGAQHEIGAYATSYIPTLGTSVTRVADAASKTGISSLIGQTEGTFFAEFKYNGVQVTGTAERIIAVGDGTVDNRIVLLKNPSLGTLYFYVASGGNALINQTSITGTSIIGGTHKVAVAYKSGDYAVYFNGTLVYTSAATGVPTLSAFFLGTNEGGTTEPLGGTVSQALLFKTRLTNESLAALTSL